MELFTEKSEAATAPPEPESPCHQTWLQTIRLRPVENPLDDARRVSQAAHFGGAVLSTIELQCVPSLHWRALRTHRQQHAEGAARHLAASVAHVGIRVAPRTLSISF
jgi:hypothetical protein